MLPCAGGKRGTGPPGQLHPITSLEAPLLHPNSFSTLPYPRPVSHTQVIAAENRANAFQPPSAELELPCFVDIWGPLVQGQHLDLRPLVEAGDLLAAAAGGPTSSIMGGGDNYYGGHDGGSGWVHAGAGTCAGQGPAGQGQGQEQRDSDQAKAGQKLAEYQGPWRHRRSEEELQRSGPPFLSPQAHGDSGSKKNEKDRHPFKKRPHLGNVSGKKGFYPEKDKQGNRQKNAYKNNGNGRAEKCIKFFFCDTKNGLHDCSPLPIAR